MDFYISRYASKKIICRGNSSQGYRLGPESKKIAAFLTTSLFLPPNLYLTKTDENYRI